MIRQGENEAVCFNGVDGATGSYLFPALPAAEIGRLARLDADRCAPGRRRVPRRIVRKIPMGPKEGVDPRRLEQAGWGVVFAENVAAAVREALAPLLEHRRRQAGRSRAERYRELSYRPGESKLRFLGRHGAGPGPADPDRLPYYLLLVGDPEAIPFSFQYQLDVSYAVGRVCFDTPEEYARYAATVVAAERGEMARPRRAAFFGVRNPGDRATEKSHDLLIGPLARQLAREIPGWEWSGVCREEATRERLARLLGGEETPALLFTASHGLGYARSDPRQRGRQGGLVCQEWEGPGDHGGPSPYFTAGDLSDEARPGGLIAFFFACFSAGTPRRNDFVHRGDGMPRDLSDRPFVADLPRRLLAHPRGGALAVVGHVDRAWTFSFDWPLAGRQLEVFASTLKRLLNGHPLGSAMEFFNHRYAELECDLAVLRDDLGRELGSDFLTEGQLWTARNDARNFMIVGDPAVRLAPFCAGEEGR